MICSNALAVSQLACITDKENITIAIITKNKNGKWCLGEESDETWGEDEYSTCNTSKSSSNIILINEFEGSLIRVDIDRYTGSFTYFFKNSKGEKFNWSGMCSAKEQKF